MTPELASSNGVVFAVGKRPMSTPFTVGCRSFFFSFFWPCVGVSVSQSISILCEQYVLRERNCSQWNCCGSRRTSTVPASRAWNADHRGNRGAKSGLNRPRNPILPIGIILPINSGWNGAALRIETCPHVIGKNESRSLLPPCVNLCTAVSKRTNCASRNQPPIGTQRGDRGIRRALKSLGRSSCSKGDMADGETVTNGTTRSVR